MSKATKLMRHPVLFFRDALLKRITKNHNRSASDSSRSAVTDPFVKPQTFYLETILQLKQAAAVNRIKFEGECLWPLLRCELMIQSDHAWKKQIRNQIAFNPYLSQLCRPDHIHREKALDLRETYPHICLLEDIQETRVDYLFFSNLNSTDHVEIGGKVCNRLIDPIYEIASKISSAAKVEIIKASSKAVEKISRYKHIPVCILPPHNFTLGSGVDISYPSRFLNDIKKHIPFIEIDENRLNSFFDWQNHMTSFYEDVLRKFSPKVVFFHPYYYYAPLVRAAKNLGIVSVDLQHGVMAGFNQVFYDNWQEIPPSGYRSLPDFFWVWSKQDAEHISQAFKAGDGTMPHRAIVGGYPWLSFTYDKSAQDLARTRRLKAALKRMHVKILITLQRDSAIPRNLAHMIDTSPTTIGWVVRKHPKGAEITSSILGKENVISGPDVDKIQLNDLFELVDFNFTDGSTTVLEADYFGVYSFVYGDEGRQNYSDLIAEHKVGVIKDEQVNVFDLFLHSDISGTRAINYFAQVNVSDVLRSLLPKRDSRSHTDQKPSTIDKMLA